MPGGVLFEVIYFSFKKEIDTNHGKLVEERYCINARFLIRNFNNVFFIVE